MELETTEYVRKVFTVRAVEVTFKNVEQIAAWCKGKVDSETTRLLGNDTELPVIKLQGQGEDRGKELVARLGYFIVEAKGRFRVYKAPQFHATFEKAAEWDGDGVLDQKREDAEECCGDHYLHNVAEAEQEKEDALHAAGQL